MGSISDGYWNIEYGTKGTRGGNGGFGGSAGLGAYGGHSGHINIEINGVDVADELVNKFENEDKSNKPSKDGEPGRGGDGALGGADGYDEMKIKRSFFNKMKMYRGRINLKTYGKSWIPFSPETPEEWDCMEIDKDKDRQYKKGLTRATGASAQSQLENSLKTRAKASKKTQTSKVSLKSQLAEALQENDSLTKDLTGDAEQRNEYLNEVNNDLNEKRESKQKSQQKESQFLDKTKRMAQQVKEKLATNVQATTQFTIITDHEKNENFDGELNEQQSSIKYKIKKEEKKLDEVDLIKVNSQNSLEKKNNIFYCIELEFKNRLSGKNGYLNQLKIKLENIEKSIKDIKLSGKNLCFKLDLDKLKFKSGELLFNLNSTDFDNEELKQKLNELTLEDQQTTVEQIEKIIKKKENKETSKSLVFRRSLSYKPEGSSDFNDDTFGLDYFNHFKDLFTLNKKRIELRRRLKELEKYPFSELIKLVCLEFGSYDSIKLNINRIEALLFKDDEIQQQNDKTINPLKLRAQDFIEIYLK